MSIVPTNTNKQALRSQLLTRRKNLALTDKQRLDDALRQQLKAIVAQSIQPDSVIALYSPIRGEPDLMPLTQEWLQAGFKIALPIVVAPNTPLTFVTYTNVADLVKNKWGILEPILHEAQVVQPDVVLIPCLGFDQSHYRLGYGGGFYDRTLAQFKANGHEALTIGVAYAHALCEFELSPFDVPLEIIVQA